MTKQQSTESLDERSGTSVKLKKSKAQSYATVTLPATQAQPRKSFLATAGFATMDDDNADSADML